jgi:hypothetical protein
MCRRRLPQAWQARIERLLRNALPFAFRKWQPIAIYDTTAKKS